MEYSGTISLGCPHCDTKCQFVDIPLDHTLCTSDHLLHIPYRCTHCQGVIVTKWDTTTDRQPKNLCIYYPIVGDWKPRVDLSLIKNREVQSDFKEAIDCYNNGLYNACMMMARRAIQQEMISNGAKDDNLYKQIESTGISKKLKALLHIVKNFGNHGAHPDFCLFDKQGNQIEDKKEFAKLSLGFLDGYFFDQYEIDSLVENAPKSEKELES